MRRIPLTQGKFAIVDDRDYKFVSQWKWYALKQPNTYYACRDIKINGRRKTIWMHRLINKTPEDKLTDHKNGEGLDNRRKNLRSVTHQQNMINNARWTPKKPKYRGVSWHKGNKKWYAQITVDYKNIYIGSFHCQEEARIAYEKVRSRIRKNQLIRRD